MSARKQPSHRNKPDHLFVSYATEDWLFVEWLTLRLTAEGYKVWTDRIKLLGGESYPKDINTAIKWRTFRFIAVLSRSSIEKPNPVKERTLALSVARERNENFVVPINLDGMSATDLNWMVSDLTFIPFYLGWADGLNQLLKLLEESNAPRDFPDGRSAAANWFDAKQFVIRKQETLWLNLAEVKQLPKDIYRYEVAVSIPDEERAELLKQWPHINDEQTFWSFEPPAREFADKYKFTERIRRRDWNLARADDRGLRQLAVRLINASLKSVALKRGLKMTPDGTGCYFPDGLVPNNRLNFDEYNKKRTWIRPAGTRNFRTTTGKESCQYHLVPNMKVWLDHPIGCVIQVRVYLFLTNPDGQPIEGKAALRRRKRICRSWWNHHWLARTFAFLQFMAADRNNIEIGDPGLQQLIISKYPLTAHIPFALDESQIGLAQPEPEDSEEGVLDLGDDPPDSKEDDPDE